MKAPNRSSAVMSQRSAAAHGLDYYPTPPWATRALCELVLGGGEALRGLSCWEPACGEGDMARPLAEYFGTVHASDIYPRGFGHVGDFLDVTLGSRWAPLQSVDWIITNPPFNAALKFARLALAEAKVGVALLLRTQWIEGVERYGFFSENPLSLVCPFVERVSMVADRLDRSAASATSLSWFVWRHGDTLQRLQHIPPCKARFDRDSDWRQANDRPSPLFPTEAA